MKKSSIALTLTALAVATASFAAKNNGNKTVMTVGPDKVTLNEFEYLFNKNNQQQTSATSLDEYIDMFVNYKLKVVAAKDAGYDTARSYLADMKKYTNELARPYMRTQAVDDSLVNVAYNHLREMTDVNHILIPTGGQSPEIQKQLADSIYNAILGGADFGELAKKYSADKNSARRNGHMGYIVGGLWPYTFEDVAFNTPVGATSEPTQSIYGYHIVQVLDRKPNPGTVKTRHILKSTRDKSPEEEQHQKELIDSLFKVVSSGADFATVARQNTDEPQGQQSGGDLPWFSPGQMVPEFNDVAFMLKPGEISNPVKTSFGWHIILCEDRKNVPPIDSLRSALAESVKKDERGTLAVHRTLDNWKHSAGTKINQRTLETVKNCFTKAGGLTADALESLKSSNAETASMGKEKVTVGQIAEMLNPDPEALPEVAVKAFNVMLDHKLEEMAMAQYIATLPEKYPDYRNLINEYRDGMLLYEVSNAEIWDKANADSAGLQNYYLAHKDNFRWERPHYKGFIVVATSDSIADEVVKFLTAPGADLESLATSKSIRKHFGNDAKVERVLAGKGDNAVVDHLCFNGKMPEIKNRWKAYRAIGGRVIDQPENARDVKGQVSLAYQQELEAEWLKTLRNRYKVTIDRKALQKAFPATGK